MSEYLHGITLQMSDESRARYENLQKELGSDQLNIRMKFRPHLTLLISSFPIDILLEVIKNLEEFSEDLNPVNVKLLNLSTIGDQYIAWDIQADDIHRIHEELLSKLGNLLVENYHSKYLERNLTPKQKGYLQKYGYHFVKDLFYPHISVGKYKNTQIRNKVFNDMVQKEIPVEKTFLFNKLYFDQADPSTDTNESQIAKVLWSKELN